MGNVSAHFEFGGSFWTVVALVVLGLLAFVWKDEIKTAFARMRDAGQT
jgi:hypothetical protein